MALVCTNHQLSFAATDPSLLSPFNAHVHGMKTYKLIFT
jgi:hypothetical protein